MTPTTTLNLPLDLYRQLQNLAQAEQTDLINLLRRWAAQATNPATLPETEQEHPYAEAEPLPPLDQDPFFALLGAYESQASLIDNIPVSEDPDLYLIAESLGENAEGLHAWEIAPTRYEQNAEGKAIRCVTSTE